MPQSDPLIGTQLGHFKIERLIAEGGMGLIYQATHTVIGRKAAIKVLSEKYSSDKNMIKRLHREARAVNRIGHPNIVDIFDFGQTPDSREYFVMEYLPGQSLAQLQERQQRIPWPLAGAILQQTLDALAAAHDLGIIHRDVKPENILVVPQDGGGVIVKILDFGIAKSVGLGPEGERLTRAGSVMGTPEYIAPEQIRGREVDGRADLYAVGVILFEMVMGRRPYESDKVINLLMMHLRDPVPAMEGIPTELGVPKFVPAVVQKALAKEPGQRFPDARTFARALGLESAAVAPSDGTRPLPELFWEKADPQSPTLPEPVTGPGMPSPLATGASPAFPTYEHARMPGGPGSSTELVEESPRAHRSSLRWVIPLAVLLLSGAAIIFYFALRPGKPQPVAGAGSGTGSGAAGAGSGSAAAPASRPVVRKDVDLPTLADSVRRTLRAGLTNTVAEVRQLAVSGTGLLRADDALPVLTARLKDDADMGVRAAAARAIAALSDPAGGAALREVRSSADEMTKVALDSALMRLGLNDGEIGLTDALKSSDENVQLSAALALGEAGRAAARQVLEKAATDEKKVSTPAGFAAIRGTLAKLGDKTSHEKLASALLQNNLGLKLSAAEALARLGDDEARSTLKQLLASTTSAPSVRLVAAKMLAALGDYAGLDTLARAVEEKDEAIKRLAADGLGAVSDKAALPALAFALEDQSWIVKATAAESLARILSQMPTAMIQRSQDWLKNALASQDWSVRHAAVGVTSDMDPELALSLIGRAYGDKDERVRREAVAQLDRVSAEKALPILKHALASDASPEVRATAARILGKMPDQGAKDALQVAVKTDKSNAVRAAVAGSLLAQGDTQYLEQLKAAAKSPNAELRRQAISALGKWSEAEAEKTLTGALKDKNAGVRFAAAYQLAMRGKATGAGELRKALGKGGEDEAQALRALASLGIKPTGELGALAGSASAEGRKLAMDGAAMLEPRQALPILKRGSVDGDRKVRLATARSLTRLAEKEPKAVPLLRMLAKDPDPTVRAQAELGLAKAAKAGAALDMGKVTPLEPPPPLPAVPDRKLPTPPPDKKGTSATPAPLFVDEKFVRFQHLSSEAGSAAKLGNYAKAIRLFKLAQKLGDKPSIPFDLGKAYLELALRKKDTDKASAKTLAKQARAYFLSYLGRYPNGPLATKAKGGLNDLNRNFGKH